MAAGQSGAYTALEEHMDLHARAMRLKEASELFGHLTNLMLAEYREIGALLEQAAKDDRARRQTKGR